LKPKTIRTGGVTKVFLELLEKRCPLQLLESNVNAAQSDSVVAELALDGKLIIKETKVNERYKFRHDEVEFE